MLPPKDNCVGCMACMNKCKNKAIWMKRDSFGCFFAEVNTEKCTKCGLCEKVCPILCHREQITKNYSEVYAAISREEQERLYSTSGGIFPILAHNVIKTGGYVAGAVYDKKLLVKHVLADDEAGISSMRQSKYVQSNSGYIYRKVEKKLNQNKKVLFTGTPCQVKALKLFLQGNKNTDKLITCELICIGVPCPGFYLKYRKYLEKKYQSHITRIWFKNKVQGWDRLLSRIEFENGDVYKGGKDTDLYIRAYRKNGFILRKSCYQCPFKKLEREADLTLGDFWNLKNTQFNDNKGISLILINSKKGKDLFNEIESFIIKEKHFLRDALKNEGLLCNTPYTWKTELYRRLSYKVPFDFLIKIADFFK